MQGEEHLVVNLLRCERTSASASPSDIVAMPLAVGANLPCVKEWLISCVELALFSIIFSIIFSIFHLALITLSLQTGQKLSHSLLSLFLRAPLFPQILPPTPTLPTHTPVVIELFVDAHREAQVAGGGEGVVAARVRVPCGRRSATRGGGVGVRQCSSERSMRMAYGN